MSFKYTVEVSDESMQKMIDLINEYWIRSHESEEQVSIITLEEVRMNKELQEYILGEMVCEEYDKMELIRADGCLDVADYR